jgi:class 3 adenylate cyclase
MLLLAREQRKLAAILAADIVGYSRLTGRDESGTLGPRKHRGATQLSALLTAERVEDAGCRWQVGTAQQSTLQARPPVNVVAVIGAAPVAFEALLSGKKMISFLAKGLLVSWCTLVTATTMA